MRAVRDRHAAWLAQILTEHDWPGEPLVGPEGAEAAWLIVQHAIAQPGLQRLALGFRSKIEPAWLREAGWRTWSASRAAVGEGLRTTILLRGGRRVTLAGFHLAQVNIVRARGGMTDPAMAEVIARLAFAFGFSEPFGADGLPLPRGEIPRDDACPAR